MVGTPEAEVTDEVETWDPVEYLRKRIPQAQYNRRSFDRIFYRNLLFYVGIQWIRYSRSSQQWRPVAVPDWFPKQTTNKYGANCDLMASVLLQSDPESVYTPASDAAEDLAAARVAGDISRHIELEVKQSELETEAAKWCAITGNYFIVDGYDSDPKHGTRFVPDMACYDCVRHVPAEVADDGCPYCGSQDLIEARDEDGEPMGKDVPIGAMYSEIAGPFEIHVDLVAKTLDQSPYVYRARTYPIALLQDLFPEYKDKIKPDDAGIDSGMFYQTALAYITNGTSSSPGNYAGSTGSIDNVPRATLYHLWVRPTKNLPDGGEALICGDATLWKSKLTFTDEEGRPFVPVTQGGFNKVAGRLFYKTPADDAIFKQTQRNMLEALIQLIVQRMSNPTWLIPKGIGINNITGEPGEIMRYNAALGAKPERIPGSEFPNSIFRWLSAIDTDMNDIMHVQDIMRGKAPDATPTFGGAQLILERSYAGFADPLKSWGRAWNESRRKRLLIWKGYASEKKTMMVLGKNQEWEAKSFCAGDMPGRVNVYLDEASVAPKSKAYEQLMAGQMLDRQLLNLNDPSIRLKVFTMLDMGHLVEDIDVDVKDAAKEKDEFVATGQPRPRPGIDNDVIHAADHAKVAKSDEFKKWPDILKSRWIEHTLYHQKRNEDAQKAAQQQDPRTLNAQAKAAQTQMELEAFAKQKQIELAAQAQRKQVDLQAHGAKRGFDAAVSAGGGGGAMS